MSAKTREQLYSDFSNNQTATGEKFKDLIDSFKIVQSAVSDPAAAGTSVTFIATIEQNAEGVITVTKKTVNFSGYQTTAGMAGYQNLDLQQVGEVTAAAGGNQVIKHGMNHFPTVRLIDSNGVEVERGYTVVHEGLNVVRIVLSNELTDHYRYILD